MCGRVDQTESVSTVLGVLGALYDDRAEDASLLMNMYSRSCHDKGAEDELRAGVHAQCLRVRHDGPDG